MEGGLEEANKGHMNRAQRRAAKPKKQKKPAWHGLTKEQKKEALFRNGITTKDLEREYDTGYKQARRELTSFTMMMFYCATAIAAHRLFGFGEARITRLLDDIQRIMTEEIGTEDMIERCKRETGMDIIEDGYDN